MIKSGSDSHHSAFRSLPHESARQHVRGSAQYTDDIAEPIGTLHAAIGMSASSLTVVLNALRLNRFK